LVEDNDFNENEGRKVRRWITAYCYVDGLYEIPNLPSLYVDFMLCLIVSQLVFETWHIPLFGHLRTFLHMWL